MSLEQALVAEAAEILEYKKRIEELEELLIPLVRLCAAVTGFCDVHPRGEDVSCQSCYPLDAAARAAIYFWCQPPPPGKVPSQEWLFELVRIIKAAP